MIFNETTRGFSFNDSGDPIVCESDGESVVDADFVIDDFSSSATVVKISDDVVAISDDDDEDDDECMDAFEFSPGITTDVDST